MTRTPDTDTTIEDIHRTRRQMAEKFGGDIRAILEDARKRQAASGRPVWRGKSSSEAIPAIDREEVSPEGERTST